MRVSKLELSSLIYTGNAYLIRGDYNSINDVNTLIDTGTDNSLINAINQISTGLGKKKVDLVILTHEHFDHSGGLKHIREICNLDVIAWSKNEHINATIRPRDGMKIKVADTTGTILYMPIHSNDSISIYFEEEKILFSGDTELNIKTKDGSYDVKFLDILQSLLSKGINTIYPGHGELIFPKEVVQAMLENTYNNVIKSEILR